MMNPPQSVFGLFLRNTLHSVTLQTPTINFTEKQMMRKDCKSIIKSLASLTSLLGFVFITASTISLGSDHNGYIPIKNDSLAAQYAPVIISGDEYGNPVRLLYRASRDTAGNLHIAYHYVWQKEENNAKGLMPFLSRNLYTGGLGLQRIMFGKGDVEAAAVTISPRGDVIRLRFETAKDYDPKKFSVTHQAVEVDGPVKLPIYLKIISWNHLFEYSAHLPDGSTDPTRLSPEYFTPKLWEEYGMIKEKKTFLKKDRAHFPWERKSYLDLK